MSYLRITKFLNLISKHYLPPCNLDRSKKVAASFCPILSVLRSYEFRRSAIGHSPYRRWNKIKQNTADLCIRKEKGLESDKFPYDTT